MMVANPKLTLGELDAAIYGTPLLLLPARTMTREAEHAAVNDPIQRKIDYHMAQAATFRQNAAKQSNLFWRKRYEQWAREAEQDAADWRAKLTPKPTRYPYPAAWDVTPDEFAAFLATFNRDDNGSMDTSTVREKRDNDGLKYKE